MPPRRTTPTIPPFKMTLDEVVQFILRLMLDGKPAKVYTVSSKNNREPSTLTENTRQLRNEHAQPLLDEGLLYLYKKESPNYYALTPQGLRRGFDLLGQKNNLDVGLLITKTLATALFSPSATLRGRTALPHIYNPSKTKSKLVLVLGENASGKSLFRRIIREMTHPGNKGGGFGDPPIPRGPFPVSEMIGLSMQGRTSGGMASFIYGAESYHSTGENSAHTVLMGIKSAYERNHTSILYWDEPDIGMSGGAAAGTGVAIREFIQKDDAPLVAAVFLTSHNPALIQQLRACDPHYIFLGDADGPKTLDEWFVWQQNPTPVTPEQLKELARKRFLDVQKVLDHK